jgi:hypothetical protein
MIKGRIYRIDFQDGYFYIGRTVNSLENRLTEHKRFHMGNHKYNQEKGRCPSTRFEIYIAKYGWGNPTITEHTYCEVDSLKEMHELELLVIKVHFFDPKCLNHKCRGVSNYLTEQQRFNFLETQLRLPQEPWREFWINKILENWTILPTIYSFNEAMKEFNPSLYQTCILKQEPTPLP